MLCLQTQLLYTFRENPPPKYHVPRESNKIEGWSWSDGAWCGCLSNIYSYIDIQFDRTHSLPEFVKTKTHTNMCVRKWSEHFQAKINIPIRSTCLGAIWLGYGHCGVDRFETLCRNCFGLERKLKKMNRYICVSRSNPVRSSPES